jgi:ubiquinone/menaquinone biosynthesis C-methylase UbiE
LSAIERLVPHEWLSSGSNTNLYRQHLYRYLFALDHISNASVVMDLAAGCGYGSQILASKANHVYGVDVNKDAIDIARVSYCAPNITFIQSDYKDVGKYVENVTHAVCFETLEHVDDPDDFLKTVSDISKNVILSVPAYDDLPVNPYHKHFFSYNELMDVVSKYFNVDVVLGQTLLGNIGEFSPLHFWIIVAKS